MKTGFDYFEKYGSKYCDMICPQQYWDEFLSKEQRRFWNKVAKLFNEKLNE